MTLNVENSTNQISFSHDQDPKPTPRGHSCRKDTAAKLGKPSIEDEAIIEYPFGG
jgi:hypothetical protein